VTHPMNLFLVELVSGMGDLALFHGSDMLLDIHSHSSLDEAAFTQTAEELASCIGGDLYALTLPLSDVNSTWTQGRALIKNHLRWAHYHCFRCTFRWRKPTVQPSLSAYPACRLDNILPFRTSCLDASVSGLRED